MVEHERKSWVDHFSWGLSRLTMVLPAIIVAVMFIEVVMRYVFARPTLWANELSLWIAGAVYLLAGLYAMQQRSHIRITLLYELAPKWLRHVFDVVSTTMLLIFVFSVIWGGFGEAWAKLMRWERFGTAWDPPLPATIKPLILLVLVVTAIQAISNLITDWNAEEVEHSILDEVDIDVEALKQSSVDLAESTGNSRKNAD
ncbi:MAG: TRAP transporter small permease [Nitratireductor sp.]|nr:TRAP transporter small permease [Nitratireductor sp.]MCC0020932.1 TRAP transporter small permease [Nitratireductor sp.]